MGKDENRKIHISREQAEQMMLWSEIMGQPVCRKRRSRSISGNRRDGVKEQKLCQLK